MLLSVKTFSIQCRRFVPLSLLLQEPLIPGYMHAGPLYLDIKLMVRLEV